MIVGLSFALIISIRSFLLHKPWPKFFDSISKQKTKSGLGGDVLANVVFTLAPLAIAFAVLLAFRYRKATHKYVRLARRAPTELVQTAGNIVGDVVGRDGLCLVLQTELRDSQTRRPHVLVGGLGVGKTAVLVQLTNLLARRGAVPVSVRLRDAGDDLDFMGMAHTRFRAIIQPYLRSEAEGDRIWRQLLQDDRIVVLADGLEEAFADEDAGRARNHRVRVAVRNAADRKCPLIIASRPHEALRALDAAITRLEPLSEDAALEHVRASEPTLTDAVAQRLLENAQITEAPLYLTIARELNQQDLLKTTIERTRCDRVALRQALLDAWLTALVSGKLDATRDVALTEPDRRSVVAHLYAHAYLGLREDTQQVTFTMWDADYVPAMAARTASDTEAPPNVGQEEPARTEKAFEKALREDIEHRIKDIHARWRSEDRADAAPPIVELQAAVSKGMQLNLVEPLTNGSRFPHSVIQAYLGSHVLAQAIELDPYLDTALENPGRELLLACVMFSRLRPEVGDRQRAAWESNVRTISRRLRSARARTEAKQLDILAAMTEIETEIADWGKYRSDDAGRQETATEQQSSSGDDGRPIAVERKLALQLADRASHCGGAPG